MEYSKGAGAGAGLALPLPSDALVFSPQSLYAALLTVQDRRDRRGVRYPLAPLLAIAVLAKLAAHDTPRAIADWARLRAAALCPLFGLRRQALPHHTTWGRVLGAAIDPRGFERVVGAFFRAAQPAPRGRGQVALCLDGKTLRGTIPGGQTRGVHLLAAYLPEAGVVLAQVAVDGKANEIVAAAEVLDRLDLRGVVVTGDALLAQRGLSAQIRRAGGDYLWVLKDNHPGVLAEVMLLFAQPPVPAHPGDFATAQSHDAAHGRVEERALTASGLLTGYLDWPGLAQVFRLRRTTQLKGGGRREEIAYGLTSLPPGCADAARLLALARGHWGIENGLHYRRDVTLREDHCQTRQGVAPQVLAALNNLVLGLIARAGCTNAAAARRRYAAQPDHALRLLTSP
jgi:predicted transposase YbfD/YdcC